MNAHFLTTKTLTHTKKFANIIARTEYTGEVKSGVAISSNCSLLDPDILSVIEAPISRVIPIDSTLDSFSLNQTQTQS